MRNIRNTQTANNGTRTLFQSILIPQVEQALKAWKLAAPGAMPMLIGGLVVSFYCKPRSTQDVDLLFLAPGYVPEEVNGFKRNRLHAYEHVKTGVEIELLDPQYLKLPMPLVQKVLKSCTEHEGFNIPSAPAIIALKAMRMTLQDRADIKSLLEVCTFDSADWHEIPADKRKAFDEFRTQEGI